VQLFVFVKKLRVLRKKLFVLCDDQCLQCFGI